MPHPSAEELEAFIVAAKKRTYVGNGVRLLSYRQGSHDLQFAEGDFVYHDSYFGGTDFAGEEVLYWRGEPVWAENYFGHILEPERIAASETGAVIQASLSKMYQEGRFLGGFQNGSGDCIYRDQSDGDVAWFQGRETIERAGRVVYELYYHGGRIRD